MELRQSRLLFFHTLMRSVRIQNLNELSKFLKATDLLGGFYFCYTNSMTKTMLFSILGVGVFVVLIILVGKGEQIPETTPEDTSEEIIMETQGKKMAFSEFLKQDKGAYQCTVNQYIDAEMTQSTQGTVFINAGNISGTFETNVGAMRITSSMVVRDGYSYTWSNMSPIGYKVAVTEPAKINTEQEMSGTYLWNAEQIGDYNCEVWDVDMTKFDLPQGISFQEI